MRGKDVVEAVRRKVANGNSNGTVTDKALASHLGVSAMNLHNWKQKKILTPLQIANLVHKAAKSAEARLHSGAVKAIMEFFEIRTNDAAKGTKPILFGTNDGSKGKHPYRAGLREELQKSHGIYIFYDSRGSALYAGKAKRLSLWTEMNSAFNRARSVQAIKLVSHPTSRKDYRKGEERQIRRREVPLSDLARYITAFEVPREMIDPLEALLVRGFANDLLNVRMEYLRAKKPSTRKASKATRRKSPAAAPSR
jgi:hypothetical protein